VDQWVGAQGRPKFPKHAFTSRIPPPKMKNVCFRFRLQDLLNPWMVWIAL